MAGQLSVYTGSEQGLLGIALDPDFETNNWVYLFWSPSAGTNQRLSRFTLVGNQLDMASEKILLDVSHRPLEHQPRGRIAGVWPRRRALHLHGRQHQPV